MKLRMMHDGSNGIRLKADGIDIFRCLDDGLMVTNFLWMKENGNSKTNPQMPMIKTVI